ncbi:helix-turn-helix domain-containing protein [Microlunatus elymi]|uniref:Helix-turn-helix domain-containing protein n=1 Tax=Microlunatus elymi TaxID=2596828 RepID=A0A516PUZ8_9ACTN|nr:helix-turn-helix domain-containing protein [Microlunatus elymi]QDP94989.1 helix-turn-helix domain-containing protein [Microlunatus elymi]
MGVPSMDLFAAPTGDAGGAGPDGLALLVTPEEAAALLRVGRSKVYELIRLGELRSLKIGGSRRISTEALHDFVSGHQESS